VKRELTGLNNSKTVVVDLDVYIQNEMRGFKNPVLIYIQQDKDYPTHFKIPSLNMRVTEETTIADVNISRYSTLKFNYSSLALHIPANTFESQPDELYAHYSFEKIRFLSHSELKRFFLDEPNKFSLIYEQSGELVSQLHL